MRNENGHTVTGVARLPRGESDVQVDAVKPRWRVQLDTLGFATWYGDLFGDRIARDPGRRACFSGLPGSINLLRKKAGFVAVLRCIFFSLHAMLYLCLNLY